MRYAARVMLRQAWEDRAEERRKHRRQIMAGRAARLDARADSGICSVINLSDGGVAIATPIPLEPGGLVRIWFECTNSINGRVAWQYGSRAGIRFLVPVASEALIGQMASDRWANGARPPRLALNSPALVTSGLHSFASVVANISQEGLGILHMGRLVPGADVALTIAGGPRVRGTVRWTDESLAGIRMNGKLTVEELSSRRGLEFLRTTNGHSVSQPDGGALPMGLKLLST